MPNAVRWIFASRLASVIALAASTSIAQAAPTGVTGGSQPFDNRQHSLGLTFGIRTYTTADQLGDVGMFSSDFVPNGYSPADGRLLPVAGNEVLFGKIGTLYGGNGTTHFALPDLRGRAIVGAGFDGTLAPRPLGTTGGEVNTTLTVNQLPAHLHNVAASAGHPAQATSITGGSQPFSNLQPTLAMNFGINAAGIYPSEGGLVPSPIVGEIDISSAVITRSTVIPANGAAIPVGPNEAIFTQIGTVFGGNGTTNFRVPNLTGRVATGRDDANGHALGSSFGVEAEQLLQSQMPAHTHALPADFGAMSVAGGGQPFENEQPSLTLRYLIALQGIFPNREDTTTGVTGDTSAEEEPILGEIKLYAGSTIPGGYAEANGQILSVSANTTLFSLIGTTFGGNGQTTFALPDLRGAVPIGSNGSNVFIGETYGSNLYTLNENQMPAHSHLIVVPEPASVALAATSFMLLRRWRTA